MVKKLRIKTKEACAILNCSESYVRREFRAIRQQNGIEPKKPIPVRKFCQYMHLDYDDVMEEISPGYKRK